MPERNGVRTGQRVQDLDGASLGRVVRLYDWGFASRRGFPILFHRDFVIRYDEVRGVRGGALVVARSSRDLLDLAAGDVPPSWRLPTPPEFPSIATPAEAALLREEIARGGVPGALPTEREAPPPAPAPREAAPVTDAEVRAYAAARGEGPIPRRSHRP